MKLFFLGAALALEPVEKCTSTTNTTGPHEFAYNLRIRDFQAKIDFWLAIFKNPSKIFGRNIYQTAQLVETETPLKRIHGYIPSWLNTHWYRFRFKVHKPLAG